MKYDNIQKVTINKLLDKYEKSKTFTGTNQVMQSFSVDITRLFAKYADDAEYELFCDVNEALGELEAGGLIKLKLKRNNIIASVSLNSDRLKESYAFVKREPKKDEHEWLIKLMSDYMDCGVLDKYFEAQRQKIAKNQKIEYYDGNKDEYQKLLKLVQAMSANEEEIFVRDYSIKLFNDSKVIDKLAAKAKALMFQYGDYQDRETVLEECGIVSTPTYVCIKGQVSLVLGGQTIDLSGINGDIALSTASIKELEVIRVKGRQVVTVENLTSFHDYVAEEACVIYLGGFHNKIKRRFIMFLHEQNPDKEYRHFGDIDAGGFYIFEHLKEKTGIPFKSVNMNVETMKRYMKHCKNLTENDKKRLNNLLEKLNKRVYDANMEDYREVVEFMLKNNCKLEQEAVR